MVEKTKDSHYFCIPTAVKNKDKVMLKATGIHEFHTKLCWVLLICFLTKLHINFMAAIIQFTCVSLYVVLIRVLGEKVKVYKFTFPLLLLLCYFIFYEITKRQFRGTISLFIFSLVIAHISKLCSRSRKAVIAFLYILTIPLALNIPPIREYIHIKSFDMVNELPIILMYPCCASIMIHLGEIWVKISRRCYFFYCLVPFLAVWWIYMSSMNLVYTGWINDKYMFSTSFYYVIDQIWNCFITYLEQFK